MCGPTDGRTPFILTTPTPFAKKAYTECPERNVPDFGRMFLKLKYTDITKNTYPKLNGYGDNGERSLKV